MQKGYIFQRHGAWYLRYRKDETENARSSVSSYANDSPILTTSTGQTECTPKGEDFLDRLDEGRDEANVATIHRTVLPSAYKTHKRPSTTKATGTFYNCTSLQNRGIRIALSELWMVKATKSVEQRDSIAFTLIHVKSFLSGVFSFARRMGL